MHYGVILGLIGQLIAVPAALFLVPTSCPDLAHSGRTEAEPGLVVQDGEFDDLLPPNIVLQKGRDVGVQVRRTDAARGARNNEGASVASEQRIGGKKSGHRQKGTATQDRIDVQEEADASGREPSDGNNDGDGFGRQHKNGLDVLRSGFEDAAEGVKEAFNKLTNPLHELPRLAADAFLSVTKRKPDAEVPAEAESKLRYLGELRLAQESADRALGTPGWAEAAQRDGVTVWKKYFPKDEYGYQYPCVKARGVITGSAEEVMGMIVDSTRVLEYNRYSKGRTDIEHLGPHTKIVWNKAQPPLSKKLHDFCTLMHMEALEDGAFMLITRATEHPDAPLLDGHVRSEILLGVTILKPAEGDPSRTEMTTVNHIVSNGVPVMIADRVSTKNAIDFIHNVENAAQAAAGKTAQARPVAVASSS